MRPRLNQRSISLHPRKAYQIVVPYCMLYNIAVLSGMPAEADEEPRDGDADGIHELSL